MKTTCRNRSRSRTSPPRLERALLCVDIGHSRTGWVAHAGTRVSPPSNPAAKLLKSGRHRPRGVLRSHVAAIGGQTLGRPHASSCCCATGQFNNAIAAMARELDPLALMINNELRPHAGLRATLRCCNCAVAACARYGSVLRPRPYRDLPPTPRHPVNGRLSVRPGTGHLAESESAVLALGPRSG